MGFLRGVGRGEHLSSGKWVSNAFTFFIADDGGK